MQTYGAMVSGLRTSRGLVPRTMEIHLKQYSLMRSVVNSLVPEKIPSVALAALLARQYERIVSKRLRNAEGATEDQYLCKLVKGATNLSSVFVCQPVMPVCTIC